MTLRHRGRLADTGRDGMVKTQRTAQTLRFVKEREIDENGNVDLRCAHA
jgi:hypothetical protein